MSKVSPARGLNPAATSQERETENREESLRRFHLRPLASSSSHRLFTQQLPRQTEEYLIGKSNSAEGTENCAQSRDADAAIDRLCEL